MLLVWLLLLLSARRCSQLVDVDMTLLPVLLLSATDCSLYWFDGWSCRFFENKGTFLFFAMSQLASSCNCNWIDEYSCRDCRRLFIWHDSQVGVVVATDVTTETTR
jgi:hypothetical protein